jgi:hypothetical protein
VTEKQMSQHIIKIAKAEKLPLSKVAEINDLLYEYSGGSLRKAVELLQKWHQSEYQDSIISGGCANEENGEAIELARALLQQKNWESVRACLAKLTADPETTRYIVLAYMNTVLLSTKGGRVMDNCVAASSVIDEFSEPFISSGKAGLANACWHVVNV